MQHFGIIGKPLEHSFSPSYFKQKFSTENLTNYDYSAFEIESCDQVRELFSKDPQLKGLNVTIPFKEEVIGYLDELDDLAAEIGAVNTIKREASTNLKGYNTDYFGFRKSLEGWLTPEVTTALILGTGGASRAVEKVLIDLEIDYRFVSRSPLEGHYTYDELNRSPEKLLLHKLIINTTPLGMHPDLDSKPDLPYGLLTSEHFLFDLVYNPGKTLFLQAGEKQLCKIKNGQDMLVFQAEKAWEIWNK